MSGAKQRAAKQIVAGLRAAVGALEGSHMVVSRSKTIMLAAGLAQRASLRTEAGALRTMVALVVKDQGVDGANRRKAAQKVRVKDADAAQSARRITRVPTGWSGRTAMALALSRSQFLWGSDVSGIKLRKGRTSASGWCLQSQGGNAARKAPEAILALACPDSFLEPKLPVQFAILRGWAKRCAIDPSLPLFVLPACEAEVWGRHAGPVSLLAHEVRELGWEPKTPTEWVTEAGLTMDVLNLEFITHHAGAVQTGVTQVGAARGQEAGFPRS